MAIFAGIRGHRDEVLTIDISADGKKFISGGIDHNLMVWSLNSEDINERIDKSHEIEAFGRKAFAALRLHFPEFSTRDIHSNYVDSVKFFGDTFLSKSCENTIIWWKIEETANGLVVSKLFTFEITECEIWFMKYVKLTFHCGIKINKTFSKIFQDGNGFSYEISRYRQPNRKNQRLRSQYGRSYEQTKHFGSLQMQFSNSTSKFF